MNTKKVLAAAAVLGILAGMAASCRHKPTPGALGVAAERKYGYAQYGNGDYTFYFKNGKNIHEDCDGYTYDGDGWVYIYEYFNIDIQEWADRLRAAGIDPVVSVTHNPFKYCFAAFPAEFLHGVGLEYIHYLDFNEDAAYVAGNGTQVKLGGAEALFYARPHENFNFTTETWGQDTEQPVSAAHENRMSPSICVLFKSEDYRNKAETILKDAGFTVVAKGDGKKSHYIVIDAGAIDWFSYDD
jgi:hypothetical protein